MQKSRSTDSACWEEEEEKEELEAVVWGLEKEFATFIFLVHLEGFGNCVLVAMHKTSERAACRRSGGKLLLISVMHLDVSTGLEGITLTALHTIDI